jgi:hypothetical protein
MNPPPNPIKYKLIQKVNVMDIKSPMNTANITAAKENIGYLSPKFDLLLLSTNNVDLPGKFLGFKTINHSFLVIGTVH